MLQTRRINQMKLVAHQLATRIIAERDGFCVEFRELWQGSSLVAMNQQTFAILA